MSVRRRVWRTKRGERRRAWVADYKDVTGRRKIRSFKSRAAAEEFWAQYVMAQPPRRSIEAVLSWLRGAEREMLATKGSGDTAKHARAAIDALEAIS